MMETEPVGSNTAGRLLKPEEVAGRLGLSPATLQIWRITGRYGLPYIKAGRRIRYREEDVDDFVARRTVVPDSHNHLSPEAL